MFLRSVFFLLLLCCIAAPRVYALPNVVASIPPLHSLVQGVMQGVAKVELLIGAHQSPHDASLAPSTVRKVMAAELVVWIGPSLELPLARILKNAGDDGQMRVMELESIQRLESRPAGLFDENQEQHSHGEHSIDPHLWLSTANARAIVVAVRDWLLSADADNADRYRNNAGQMLQRIEYIHQQIKGQLDQKDAESYMVFHDAYQYFEQDFSIHPVAAVTLHPEHAPGAKRIHMLRQYIKQNNVHCIFSEPQFSAAVVGTIVEGSSVKHATLDPLGLSLQPGPDLWFDLMQQLATQLSDCLQSY